MCRQMAQRAVCWGQQNGRNWGNWDAASIDGINLRDGMTVKLDGLSGEEGLRKGTADP
jgi:hypothetical protein